MRRPAATILIGLAVCGTAAALAAASTGGHAAAAVAPAHVSGTIRVSWTSSLTTVERASGTLVYRVGGVMLNERGRQRWAPAAFPSGYRPDVAKTRLEYIPATLVSATYHDELTQPCADGSTATQTVEAGPIVASRSIFSHYSQMEVNVLTGRGSAAIEPYYRFLWQDNRPVGGMTIWRSLGSLRLKSTNGCPDVPPRVPAVAQVETLVPHYGRIIWSDDDHRLPIRIAADGSLHLKGSYRDSGTEQGERVTMTVSSDIVFRGPLQGMSSGCVWPSDRALSGARTPDQALAILHRAGLVTSFAGDQYNAYVPAGHFFVKTGGPSWPCGIPLPKVLWRSKGRG
jgi:hypothetical protein